LGAEFCADGGLVWGERGGVGESAMGGGGVGGGVEFAIGALPLAASGGASPSGGCAVCVLREKWKANPPKAFFWFFMAQAVLVWLLMLPVYLVASRTEVGWHPLEVGGLLLWLGGLVGEGLADAQLTKFKRENRDPKAICTVGLWHYSRHPNYFFQSLLWWGLFLMALPAQWGWLALLAPLAMLHFLLNVTGIPLTEKLAVAKRGDVYREYQRTTRAFVPWKKRE
jgi:steroid 5-alpha reductase family enzyme